VKWRAAGKNHSRDETRPARTGAGHDDLATAILMAGHLVELRLDDVLRPTDLTVRQYHALRHIGDHPGVTRPQLATALCVTRQAAGGLGQRLHRAGLIERDRHGPGGPVHFRLTAAGRRQLQLGGPIVAEAEHDILKHLPSDSACALRAVINELSHQVAQSVPVR
jgi:DNA-binding MarR family transcriptional regulator